MEEMYHYVSVINLLCIVSIYRIFMASMLMNVTKLPLLLHDFMHFIRMFC